MCFATIAKNIIAWLFGDFFITKDNYAAFMKELKQQEEAEAEKKKEAEALQNARFQSTRPFRHYPEARCLAADPWRESDEAKLESRARFKLAMAQEQEEHPSKAELNELFDLIRFAFDCATNKVRVLEDRLELMLGQRIPQLPPNEDDEPNNWN